MKKFIEFMESMGNEMVGQWVDPNQKDSFQKIAQKLESRGVVLSSKSWIKSTTHPHIYIAEGSSNGSHVMLEFNGYDGVFIFVLKDIVYI